MNEADENLTNLKKAAGVPRAPKLSEDILHSATKSLSKSGWRERVGLLKKQNRLSLAGVATAVVLGLLVTPLVHPAITSEGFHLTLGAQQPSGGEANPTISVSQAQGSKALSDSIGPRFSDMQSYYPMIGSPWLDQTYFLPSTKISDQPGSGTVYRVENLTDTESLAKKLSEFFGLNERLITKEIGALGSSADGNYHVANYQDAGVYLSTFDYGSLQFSFFDPSAWVEGPCLHTEEAKTPVDLYGNPTKESDPSNTSKSYCTVFKRPTPEFPNDKEAQLQVAQLAKKVGMKFDPEDVTINRTKDYLSAQVRLLAGGDETSYTWYVNWGNTGKIQNASGSVIRFAPVANLKTVSPIDAVSRMTDGRWYATMSGSLYRYPSAHWNEKFETVTPKEPIESFRKTRIVVELAMAISATVVDASGQEWIVPGYAMYQDKGITAIVALEDGVIELPENVRQGYPPVDGYVLID